MASSSSSSRKIPPSPAATWYARPYNGSTGYGTSDGTSYENAFNGTHHFRAAANPLSIDWNRIAPGDTLYVCGFHDGGGFDYAEHPGAAPHLRVNGSGTEGNRITVSGDCPDDPGTIFGSGANYTDGWELFDAGNNIYSRPYSVFPDNLVSTDQAFERPESLAGLEGIVRLNRPENNDFASWDPGSYIKGMDDMLYYRPTSGSANDYTFYLGYVNGNLLVIDVSHINIEKITLLSSNNNNWGGNLGIRENAHNITVDSVHARWGGRVSIGLGTFGFDGFVNENITIKNSIIRNARSGIYGIGEFRNFQVIGNQVYDYNQRLYYGEGDTHGIGIQGGYDGLVVEHNHVYNRGGEGILFYYDVALARGVRNGVIRYNHVHDIKNFAPEFPQNQRGIEFGSDQYGHVADTVYNNRIYYNYIHDIGNEALDPDNERFPAPGVRFPGIGIRIKALLNSSYGSSWFVHDNVVENANLGFVWIGVITLEHGPGFTFEKNTIKDSRSVHAGFYKINEAVYDHKGVIMDKNIYQNIRGDENTFFYPEFP